MDMEKVIRGIERCLVCETSVMATEEGQKAYRECEYTTWLYCRRDNLLRDAIALLKEQENDLRIMFNRCQATAKLLTSGSACNGCIKREKCERLTK